MRDNRRMGQPNRSLMNHGSGKGDKDRTFDKARYNANLDEVRFSGIPASQDPEFGHVAGRSIKVYGTAQPPTLYTRF